MNRFVESMESRSLFSVSVPTPVSHAGVSLLSAVTAPTTPVISDQQKANLQKLGTDLKTIKSHSQVTSEQIAALASDLKSIAQVAHKPSDDSVNTLKADWQDAIADKSISTKEKLKLTADVQAVLSSAGIPLDLAAKTASDFKAIVTASGVTKADVELIVTDLQAIWKTFVANHPKP